MTLEILLEEFSNKIIDTSPFTVVEEAAPGKYLYISPFDLTTVWVDGEEGSGSVLEPTPVHLNDLNPFSVTILNGGSVAVLDADLLEAQKSHVLSTAASFIGARAFGLVRSAESVEIGSLDEVAKLDCALDSLGMGDYPGAFMMCNPSNLIKLKQGILSDRVNYRQTGMISTNNLIDDTYPIFSPRVRGDGVLFYNREDSIVLQGVRFYIEENRLKMDFSLDICEPRNVRMFDLAER